MRIVQLILILGKKNRGTGTTREKHHGFNWPKHFFHVNRICSNDSVLSIANPSAESITGTREHPEITELPPAYDEIKCETFDSLNGGFYDDENQFLYPTPPYLSSPAPSCPSDDLYSEEKYNSFLK